MQSTMYDDLSTDYDRFVNWHNRLAIELPFIIQQLQRGNNPAFPTAGPAGSVLDAATGTGMHAIALAQHGYSASGADISPAMIERARLNALSANVPVRFEVADFGNLTSVFGQHTQDAILCLGNSLPHLLSLPELDKSLRDFASSLKPGGLLLIQNRNFDAVMQHHERWMEPQSHSEAGSEWIFQRFYDFDPDGLITFNMVTLKRTGKENWSQTVACSRLRPLLQGELLSALSQAGFEHHQSFGSMSQDPFVPEKSGNLVVVSHRA